MSARNPIVYVVDDDASVRRSMTLLLKTHGYRTATFSCAADFLAFDHPRGAACLVLDVNLPGLDGPGLQDVLVRRAPAIPIVFITGHGTVPISVKAMKLGAVDFLLKPFTASDLLDAIRRALLKATAWNKEFSEGTKIRQRIATLSPRELEVFHFVARGLLNKQIATKRGTSLQTIKVHRSRVMQKMRARTVTELINLARKAGVAIA